MIPGVNFVHKSVSETVRFWDNRLASQLRTSEKDKYLWQLFPNLKGILPSKILDCGKENPSLEKVS